MQEKAVIYLSLYGLLIPAMPFRCYRSLSHSLLLHLLRLDSSCTLLHHFISCCLVFAPFRLLTVLLQKFRVAFIVLHTKSNAQIKHMLHSTTLFAARTFLPHFVAFISAMYSVLAVNICARLRSLLTASCLSWLLPHTQMLL